MKKQLVLLALGFSLSTSSIAFAENAFEQDYVDSYRGQTGTPIPVSVETPIVGTEYVGSSVDLKFVVDKSGRPSGFVALTPADEEFLDRVVDAVSRWEFEPLRDANGQPISSQVRLPVRIVTSGSR